MDGLRRLRLLPGVLAGVVAFLLVSTATAGAFPVTIEFESIGGGGEGWVKSTLAAPPGFECHWNGAEIDVGVPGAGKCEGETGEEGGLEGVIVAREADPFSEFAGWEVIEGTPIACGEFSATCGVLTFGTPIIIKAIFRPGFIIDPTLAVTTTGAGSGTVISDPAGIYCGSACWSFFGIELEVQLTAVADAGSEFTGWTGCDSETEGKCVVTMSPVEEVSANFELQTFSFTTEVGGAGSIECEVNGGGLGACPVEASYGDAIKVVATPLGVEWVLASLTGTGSAAGNCSAGIVGICEFTITGASSVSVVFKSQFHPQPEGPLVHGEVPQTTSLESECASVDLGQFIPGVEADYSNTCGLVLTSTGAETALGAEDESEDFTGHLVQGLYFLPSALEAKAADSEGKGTGAGLTPLASPATLLTFPEPIGKDAATLEFSQHIGEHDGLHTGGYAKTITLVLEQTIP